MTIAYDYSHEYVYFILFIQEYYTHDNPTNYVVILKKTNLL